MKMKKFINDPANLTTELLEGFALANQDLVRLEEDNTVVNKALDQADRVTIVTPVSYTHLDVYKRQGGNADAIGRP